MRSFALTLGLLATVLAAPPAAHAKRLNLVLSYGQDVLVTGDQDLSVRAQCVQNENGSGFDFARLYVTTTGNAVLRSTGTSYYGNGQYVTPLTPPSMAVLVHALTDTGLERYMTTADSGSTLDVDTKRGFTVSAEATMFGINTESGDCLISVNLTTIKKFTETF